MKNTPVQTVKVRVIFEGSVVELEVPGPLSVYRPEPKRAKPVKRAKPAKGRV